MGIVGGGLPGEQLFLVAIITGQMSRGKLSRGNCSEGNCPGRNCPVFFQYSTQNIMEKCIHFTSFSKEIFSI